MIGANDGDIGIKLVVATDTVVAVEWFDKNNGGDKLMMTKATMLIQWE